MGDIFSIEALTATLYALPGIILGFSLHEFSHAYAAYKLGDNTAKNMGRLTLDPVVHIDPVGFIMLILFHFGWAKPVPVNSNNFKHPKMDDNIVSLAGPASNFILAILLAGVIKLFYVLNAPDTFLVNIILQVLLLGVIVNIGLGIFNLLPIPPLDGSHLLFNLLPAKYSNKLMEHYNTIIIIALLLMFTGAFGYVIRPAINWVLGVIFGMYGIS
ncbi:MAG TPA: site-2 protease family protein [Clostridiales bacterium]|nr:site-2 protease family protein [Clostridiales bacterium]